MSYRWNPIETAPYDTPVEVQFAKGGGKPIVARLLRDHSMKMDETPCDQWVAEVEGKHPRNWSEGACWENNADDQVSEQPIAWRLYD